MTDDLISRAAALAIFEPATSMVRRRIQDNIRALPAVATSQPMDTWSRAAAEMLLAWDTWFNGIGSGDREAADRLSISAAFAAQAFEFAASNGITSDSAPMALLRAFLQSLIDPLHPDLDYLRADPASGDTARAARDAAPPKASSVAASQPADPVVKADSCQRVTVKPLVWDHEHMEGWVFARGGVLQYAIMLSVNRVYGVHGEHDGAAQFPTIEAAKAAAQADYEARILAAIDTQPIYDPRDAVIARLVEALEACIANIEHADMSDGVCCCGDNMDGHSDPMSCGHAPVDMGEHHAHLAIVKARAAIAAAKGGASHVNEAPKFKHVAADVLSEAAETVITAMQDGNVWRHAVNTAMPILNADLDGSWKSVTDVRAAINAALVAIKNGASDMAMPHGETK